MPPKRQASTIMETTTYSESDLENLLYKEVGDICKKLGIAVKGKKGDLIKSILNYQPNGADEKTTTTTTKSTGKGSKKRTSDDVEEEDNEATLPVKDEEEEEEEEKPVTRPTKRVAKGSAKKPATKKVEVEKKDVSDEEEEEEEEEEKTTTTTTTTTNNKLATTSENTKPFNTKKASTYALGKWTLHADEIRFYLSEYITRSKIVAFDMDDTLIHTKSGATFAKSRDDWQWWDKSVPATLKKYHQDGYQVIIITNQGGIGVKGGFNSTKYNQVSGKINDLCTTIGIPCIAMMACDKDGMWRKPNNLMWEFLMENCTDGKVTILPKDCMYVGDAAGRPDGWKAGKKKDFAASDLGFALASGISFKTPEEFFLGEAPYSGASAATNIPQAPTSGDVLVGGGKITSTSQEIVLCCGFPASGKSTFSRKHFVPAGYVHVNRDTLKTKEKCWRVAEEALAEGKSVIVDNTNPSSDDRKPYIKMAKEHGIPCRCFRFSTSLELAQHLNYFRERIGGGKHVPGIGYNMYKKNFQEPALSEGYSEIKIVNFILDLAPDQVAKYNVPKPK